MPGGGFPLLRPWLIALVALLVLAPATEAGFGLRRIVLPYGLDERHIPVIAGFEVAPHPLRCGVGPAEPATMLYENDFDSGLPALEDRVAVHAQNILWETVSLFHETDFVGKGTEGGHGGGQRLYFGTPTYGPNGEPLGSYKQAGVRVAGVVALPPMVMPAETTYLAWNEKFEVEALLGYDHMWIEVRTIADDQVYILCTSDVDGRPDPGKNETTTAACSPYRVGICPNGLNGGFGTDYAYDGIFDASIIPLAMIDPDAPHWQKRWVELPAVFAGQAMEVRFSFDTADPTSNVHMGWMVDDVRVFHGAVESEPYVYAPPLG